MRGVTVLLLALLTRAQNPCCRSLSLRDAERQNENISEDKDIKFSTAFKFAHVLVTCRGCFVEKCQSTLMLILSVEKFEVITVQVFRWPVLCLCKLLNRQIMGLGEQHTLEPNQTILGLHKVVHQSSSSCLIDSHVCLLSLKYTDINFLHVHKNCTFADNVWTNTLQLMYELNVKNHTEVMMCFLKEEQMNITGAWFMSTNFTEGDLLNESNVPGLTLLLPCVKVAGAAVKALISVFPWQTDHLTMPSSICVCTTLCCKCVLSLHRSLCMIYPLNGDSSTGKCCTEFYQFIHIWRCSQDQQRELNQMDKNSYRSYMLTCMRNKKDIGPLQWQICTQLLNRGLFHQWIMAVLLMTVFMFLLGHTAVLTYISYKQRYVSIHRVRNSHLSFLLLFTISWCSLNPLTVSGQSSGCSCKLHNTAFGITFVLCISCVVGKKIVVLLAFKATIPGSNVMKWFGPLPQRLCVPACTLTEILVCVFWFSIQSLSFNMSMNCNQVKMTLECDLLTDIGFCPSLGHLVLLVVLRFILMFLVSSIIFSVACYSVLNVHAIMCVMTRI
ncbi:uncharacterized protein LOC127456367 [Myxocyprinus asiaticus]|uniref:uncharacterized protein LOC127456367 n=1 Tax=Myxocyprinus asiaticus TaxID=70543 RepID=UPI002221C530|nr:uncharacterized protein LOC127456367 [Myxocyprinus asiaticus]